MASIRSFLHRLLRLGEPRRGLYDNPYPAMSDQGIAWAQGRNATDWSKNPYPPKSAMWHAWKSGNEIRNRVETTVW